MRTTMLALNRSDVTVANDPLNNTALLRLMQLVSPALPIGAYAYSQGLETAVHNQWVTNEAEARQWIFGLMSHGLCHMDVPVFKRLYAAWRAVDEAGVQYWNDVLYASREAAELQREDAHLGVALAKLLEQLGIEQATPLKETTPISLATSFSLAAVVWGVPCRDAAMGYLWSWLENQVAAAVKLVPLGQTAGQRILSAGVDQIPRLVTQGFEVGDERIGFLAPAMAMACASHEAQYSRLFQS